ncbi:hypothetical protein BDV12DRAFT_30220 [Aspergillus spectabilis]
MPRKHRPPRPREPKACRACASAKVRCDAEEGNEFGDGGGACKRCLRLGRECTMQAPGAHRRSGLDSKEEQSAYVYHTIPYRFLFQCYPPSRARLVGVQPMNRLESKLNARATALYASSGPGMVLNPNINTQIADARSSSAAGARTGAITGASLLCESIIPFSSEKQAQKILHTFQTQLAPYFPFVIVPMDTTVPELRQTKPFLFSVIVMVSCFDDNERQIDIATRVRDFIGVSIVAQGGRSLDILQGLLVWMGWYHFQSEMGAGIQMPLGNLLHLAVAIVGDLGLNRRPGSMDRMVLFGDTPMEYGSGRDTHRTLEEKRVYLGCFYMSAMISTCHKTTEPMRYMDYTEDCCQAIAKAANNPIDLYPVRLVRFQRITDTLSRTLSSTQINVPGYPSPPLLSLIKTLETELQHLRPPLPVITLHDSILLLHTHSLEIRFYEVAFEDDFLARHGTPSERVDLLSGCLTATKAFFDVFASIPPRYYVHLVYPVFAAYSHALATLSSLLLFAGEGWDRKYVQGLLDIPAVVEAFIGRIEEAGRMSHVEDPPYHFPEVFVRMISRLRAVMKLHKARHTISRQNTTDVPPDNSRDSTPQDTIWDMMFQLPHGFSWRFLHPR